MLDKLKMSFQKMTQDYESLKNSIFNLESKVDSVQDAINSIEVPDANDIAALVPVQKLPDVIKGDKGKDADAITDIKIDGDSLKFTIGNEIINAGRLPESLFIPPVDHIQKNDSDYSLLSNSISSLNSKLDRVQGSVDSIEIPLSSDIATFSQVQAPPPKVIKGEPGKPGKPGEPGKPGKPGKDAELISDIKIINNNLRFTVGKKIIDAGKIPARLPESQAAQGGGGYRTKKEPVNGNTFLENMFVGVSENDQDPAGTDSPLSIEFGPAQGDSNSPAQLLADGTTVFNEAGSYSMLIFLQYGRDGGAGTSWLYFRGMISFDGINYTQTGGSVLNKVQNSNDDRPFVATFDFSNSPPGTHFRLEIMRGSEGNNSGGLRSFSPAEPSWERSYSAQISLGRVRWNQV